MDIAASLIKLFFGSKADKDRKEVEPYLVKIKAVYPTIEALSNDELRAHSSNLKKQIANFIAADEARIVELKARLELPDTSLSDKEKISKEIDETVKRIDEKIEQKLDELLPEAFAIMKDTARRFAQNETVEVTANDFDRELAATKDFVKIEGDKAIYATHWLAGGNDVRWDMIHYDVQLFGGVVLHKGKIAEMATGEGKTLVATLPVFLNALAGKGVHMVTVNDYLARRDSEWMGPMYQFHGLTVDCIDRHQPNSDARRKAYMADITFGTNNEYGFDYLRDNMASSPKDLVQRKHHYAIVDEVDSVLIDDARTPLIISGPVPKGDDQLFEQYRPAIEHLYNLQKNLVTNLLAESRQLLGEGKNEEGGIKLYRSHKGLPKYKPLIKFLSEQGIKAQMQKTENIYMQDNNRRMPEITDDLYFVIDEKMNSVELTDKGHEALSKYFNEEGFFVLPDIGARIAEIEKEEITPEEKAQKRDAVINDYAVKAERVHTVIQLLKAYAMFEKDVEYVVMDNKVKIVDEQTGRILDGRRYSDGLHQAIEAKERVKVEAATQTFATITLQNYFRMYHKLAGMTGTAETEASEFWSIYKLDVVVIPTNRKVIRDDRQDLVYKTKREKYNAVIEEIVKLVEQGRPVLVGTTSVEISELLSRMLKLRGIKHNVLNAKQHQLEAQIVAEAGRSGQVTIATNMAGRGTDIKLGEGVVELGGLHILGTERHESRRIDNQLRGRSGRQGDPGSSRFYLSLEDDLMRLFGSDRLSGLMQKLGMQEGEPIENNMVSRAIENAQKRVEGHHFEIRKTLLDYDNVMNQQRTVIYSLRRDLMQEPDLEPILNEYLSDLLDDMYAGLEVSKAARDIEDEKPVRARLSEVMNIDRVLPGDAPLPTREEAQELVQSIMAQLREEAGPLYADLLRYFLLEELDRGWKEHLRNMDFLRDGIGLRGYGQRDPKLEYKREGFNMFQELLVHIREGAFRALTRVRVEQRPTEVAEEVVAAPEPEPMFQHKEQPQQLSYSNEPEDLLGAPAQAKAENKPGRNDPCPCGSGKKYKKCCGANEN